MNVHFMSKGGTLLEKYLLQNTAIRVVDCYHAVLVKPLSERQARNSLKILKKTSKKTVVVDFVASLSKATAVIFRNLFAILLDITRPGICEVGCVAVSRHLKETFANSAPKKKTKRELINNSICCTVFTATTKTQVFKLI